MAALLCALRFRRGAARARLVVAIAAFLLAVGLSAPRPVQAAGGHSIDGVRISLSRGFVHGSAWFEDIGPGRSRVHVWIDTYSGGNLTGSLAHRTGMSSCDPGATCYALLTTTLQASAGECYILRAMSARGADLVQARAPASGFLCN